MNLKHCSNAQEWILIDNASNPETKAGLAQFIEELTAAGHSAQIVTESENTGVAKAWNKGLSLATCHWINILNNDAVLAPNWDVDLVKHTQAYRLDLSGPLYIEPHMVPNCPNPLAMFGEGGLCRHFQLKNRGRMRLGYFGGVVIFGEKAVFERLGAFDPAYWLSMEEIDLQYRAMAKGLRVGKIGDVIAFHYGSLTRAAMDNREQGNQAHFAQKAGWNFSEVEGGFLNKLIHSYQKKRMYYTLTMTRLALRFPKANRV